MAEIKNVLVFGEGAPPGHSISDFAPPHAEHFGVNLQVFIGTTDSDLVDSFDLVLCSPSWMAAKVAAGEWTVFRNVAARIGRLIPWEFDYKYDEHVNQQDGQPFPSRP